MRAEKEKGFSPEQIKELGKGGGNGSRKRRETDLIIYAY